MVLVLRREFPGLTCFYKSIVGQWPWSMLTGQIHIEEVHPLKHLSKYGSNPLTYKENRTN